MRTTVAIPDSDTALLVKQGQDSGMVSRNQDTGGREIYGWFRCCQPKVVECGVICITITESYEGCKQAPYEEDTTGCCTAGRAVPAKTCRRWEPGLGLGAAGGSASPLPLLTGGSGVLPINNFVSPRPSGLTSRCMPCFLVSLLFSVLSRLACLHPLSPERLEHKRVYYTFQPHRPMQVLPGHPLADPRSSKHAPKNTGLKK